MTVCSIPYLLWYLTHKFVRDDDFPWNKLSCFALVCFVIKKNHRLTHTVSSLEEAAKQYLCEGSPMERISQVFANSFIPEAQIHFTVPKLNNLSDTDRDLNKNEILAGFLDFLVQILTSEANVDTARAQRYVPLGQKLLFLLAILGDKPFDGNNQHSVFEEQIKHLLGNLEALANEAGSFIYLCVFTNPLVVDEMMNSKRNVLLQKFDIFNVNIKQHCINFSELHLHDVPRSNIVDSFFIIHSLIDDLDDFPPDKLSPVKVQISLLHNELRSSQAVLKFIEGRKDDGSTKESLGQIRDLAYEAEYLINSYIVGTIHAWYLDLRLPSITQKIKIARERLQRIKEMQTSQVNMRNGGEISYVSTAPAELDNHFVELQHNTFEILLADLIGKTKSPRQTVLIFGMPGLGKTTIANKLYRCTPVSDYFYRRVWCVVSQTYNLRSLLINILTHLGHHSEKDEILKKSDAKLREDIHKSLKEMRYLIVLDDVWDSNAWNDLRRYLPDDRNGSRVIITSRIKDVAPDGSIYHTLPLFSEVQCWELLKKKIFLEEPCPAELIKSGMGIAAKCFGIPLAVITTAGILANLERKEDAWKRVEQQLNTFLLDGLSDYRKILELSYEHLPLTLKPCFLYFAAFPGNSEISINQLAWLWIAEGFIRGNEGNSQEQIAELYLFELMNRSLVIPGKRGAGGRTKTCRVHDLLHDISVMKANEKNFLNSNNALSIYEKHQRSYHSSTSNTYSRPFGLHCRSFIGGLPDKSCFQTRALLKVLDIRPSKFKKYYAISFDLPTQLRYLGVNHLTDQMITNLDNLEFINIINSGQVKMPSIILRMKKLKHLIVKKEAMFEDDGYVSRMTNLITLLCICIDKPEDEAILRDSPLLQKLKCNVGGKMFPDLSFLEELETLKLDFKSFSKKRVTMVSNLNFPSTLKNLCLNNSSMPWEKMSIIGKLPNLCVLKLENNAFFGDKWETLDGEFQELRFLKLELFGLKQWISCSEHFPKLERLVLINCRYLEEIPCDLGNIQTLERIDVEFCSIKAALSAVGIEQEQLEYGNTELRVNIAAEFWTKKELEDLFTKNMGISKNVSVLESDGEQMYELSSIICSPERDFLVRNNGEQIKVNGLKGKIIGIYFSAFWLESCQLFTPKLIKVYNELNKYGHIEIVLVSSYINDEEVSYNLNFSKLPWMAIPISDSNARNKLSELFAIDRPLPRLVILDENGKVLTKDGVSIIEDDGREGYLVVPECISNIKQLEGEPKELIKQPEKDEVEDNHYGSLEYLLVSKTRDYVLNNDGTKVLVSSLVGKTILLFFGANHFVECKKFNQKLVQTYHEINEETNNSLEVIFISCDKDKFAYKEFFDTMPWLGLPFNDRLHFLSRFFTVTLLPRLVVIGPTGKTVMDDGWALVEDLGAEAYPFTSQRLKEIDDRMMKLCPRKVWKETHEHELVLHTNKRAICDGCDDYGYYWIYQCEKCYFSLHPKCALGNGDKEQMTESKPNKEVQRLKEIDDRMMKSRMTYEHDLVILTNPKCALGNDLKGEMTESLESLLVSETLDYVIDSMGTKCALGDDEKVEAIRNDSLESLLISDEADHVIDLAGTQIRVSSLVGKKIMLFFAAHWCPACRFVLPELIKKYHENKEKHHNSVEVIFVSLDKDQSSYDELFAMMPWLALPFNDCRRQYLSSLFKVKATPMLFYVEPSGKIVEDKVWELISYPGKEAHPFTYEWVQSQVKAQRMVIFWPKKVTIKLHEHELCLVKQILYDCNSCHGVGFDWSYKCETCVFNLHANCALMDDKSEVKGN